ncbi:hypothetical protein HGH92_03035 [Chitinophaga varians]|uniref:Uncharacterized protein n=1 Tax=Chitinophaga varians TaxID=2202339 RepID=A0A847RB25_9BACT|nr:DUF6236 family protein [Chitinophaga varians]NLR63270.1 hypothetical protein [Chitinophaga varians]
MGFTKALFYPTIDIHNEEWLKNATLFWDEINTIVPSSFTNPYQEDTTQYLFDEGILKAMPVSPDDDFIEELTSDTLNYLNTNEGFQLLTQGQGRNSVIHRDKLPRDVSRFFDIHPEKLPYEIQNQLRRSLNREGFFRVDSNFAVFYMTLLANKICEQKSIALLTDNSLTSNLSDLVRLDNQIAIKGRNYNFDYSGRKERYIHLAQGLLTNLVIKGVKVTKASSLEDIVKFKRNHRDELGLFRTNIAKLTKDVAKDTSFEALQQQVEDIYNDEFLPAYRNFKKSLDSAGIKWTSDNFMKIAVLSIPATAIPIAIGLSTPQALLAGAGISIISSLVSYNVDKSDKLRASPYSYLLAVDRGV